jgi:hypothetical protein
LGWNFALGVDTSIKIFFRSSAPLDIRFLFTIRSNSKSKGEVEQVIRSQADIKETDLAHPYLLALGFRRRPILDLTGAPKALILHAMHLPP